MDPTPLEDLALLEVLQKISQGAEPAPADSEVEERLTASGLVVAGSEGLELTAAGIALCKSLQHRVAVDTLAQKSDGQVRPGALHNGTGIEMPGSASGARTAQPAHRSVMAGNGTANGTD